MFRPIRLVAIPASFAFPPMAGAMLAILTAGRTAPFPFHQADRAIIWLECRFWTTGPLTGVEGILSSRPHQVRDTPLYLTRRDKATIVLAHRKRASFAFTLGLYSE